MSLEEKSIVSIITPGIIILILVGVSGMLSKTRLTRKSRIISSLAKMSLEEKSIVSIITPRIIILILAGVSGMFSKTRLTRKS